MKVILTGDMFLGGDLLSKDMKDAICSVKFTNAHKRIVNLEQPISNKKNTANKCTLYTDSSSTIKLKQLSVDAVNLAHNHIQDKCNDGIVETLNHLDNENIEHFGAGKNLDDAKKPYWITQDLCVLGYCEYDKPYLKQIQVATEDSPGVNPLRYESIIEDLEQLPKGKKAILYFHWGREHVWFPPRSDIELAKQLLDHEKVALIAGMHCHRVQGYIEHNGKRAYMSLGNFLFPNFFIEPPTQIAYPEKIPVEYMVTRQYHSVNQLTYKKWRIANRISLILEYDTSSQTITHIPVIQDDNEPKVREATGFYKTLILDWVEFLSIMYQVPIKIYDIIEKFSTFIVYKAWYSMILIFKMRQEGVKSTFKKALELFKKKIHS